MLQNSKIHRKTHSQYLPACKGLSEYPSIEKVKMTKTNKVRVLLVEDNELMRHGLRAVLDLSNEFEVVGEAEDGEQAVATCLSVNPDVVVMDIGLPVMNGIDATKKIKENQPQIPVVMLTSHENDTEIFAALSAGAAGYCLKDCASERIKTALASVSEGAAWIDPRIAGKVLKVFENPTALVSLQSSQTIPALGSPGAMTSPSSSDLLSHREKEVLRLMVDGASNKEISDKLIISVSTVRTHVEHILEKLAVSGRTQAAVKAMKEGLL
jgi:DNA-binding NarL/FixJ family response regulator